MPSPIRYAPQAAFLTLLTLLLIQPAQAQQPAPTLEFLGRYETGLYNEGAAEIVDYDPETQQLFFVNADETSITILDLSDPANPTRVNTIDMSPFGAGANSVAVKRGVVAVAVGAEPAQHPGQIVFFDPDGNLLGQVTVGAGPDGVAFTPDGMRLVVANEGEPSDDYTVDPEGTISIIDLSGGAESATVRTAGFQAFNAGGPQALPGGVRIFGPGASVAEDLEPEFVTVSEDGTQAFVTLQENNAVAVVDLDRAEVVEILGLGSKDHRRPFNPLDASDEDGRINIQNWPVQGLYQPDGIASYTVYGQTYLVTANEGDARDYDAFSEEARIGDLELDPHAYPNAPFLQQPDRLGRLLATSATGDADGDGDIDQIFTFGARSFSIWNAHTGRLVYDSGDDFEQITAEQLPDHFNSDDEANDTFDERSDAKGPEPEGVVIGVVGGRTYAFIGLERIGGVMVYDITDPRQATFVDYLNTRNFDVDFDPETVTPEQLSQVGDLSPEGIVFIPAEESPNGQNLLVVSYEISGTVSVYGFGAPSLAGAYTLQLLHATDLEAGIEAVEDAPRFSAVVNALRDDFANTLLLSSGDNYIPGPFLNAGDSAALAPLLGEPGPARADIAIMNAIGFDASALGNHEFDNGPELLASVVDEDGAFPGAQFPYLSANLRFIEGSPLQPLVVEPQQAPMPNTITESVIIDVNGEQIGVIGATTPTLPSVSEPGDSTLVLPVDPEDLRALAAVIQECIEGLRARGVDKIILASHLQQFANETEIARLLSGVDIVIAGGSDSILADEEDRLRTGDEAELPYPVIEQDRDGNPVLLVSSDGNYRYVGRLVVAFDTNGVVLPESIDPNVSGAFATDEQGVEEVGGAPDPAVAAIAGAVEEAFGPALTNVFGVAEVFLNGEREDVRTQETNLGNLTADANLAVAQDVDPSVVASVKNGGGIRASIGQGDLSQLDIENALRFNNGLTLLTLSAQDLLEVIEHGVAATEEGATPGQFPQVGGLRFSFDPEAEPGDRVQSLVLVNDAGEVTDVVVQNGEIAGAPGRTFRIVTLGFLAGGGDGYPFPDLAENVVDLTEQPLDAGVATFAAPGSEQDALAEYVAANFGEENPFALADTPPEEDERIQNLEARDDGLAGGTLASNLRAAEVVREFSLDRNAPNPFRDVTTIQFQLPAATDVSLVVYDLLGRQVARLASGRLDAGVHRVRWDGRDSGGQRLSSGVYLYRLEAGADHGTGQMVLVR